MRTNIIISVLLSIAALIAAACGGGEALPDKTIKSTAAGNMTVALASATGELKNGENELILSFSDASGKPVDVGAASLTFHMPAMAAMAEMNDQATLTTTGAAGKYRAAVNIEVGGTWEAIIKYEGKQGSGEARMTVIAK